jgi:hypothetical protein
MIKKVEVECPDHRAQVQPILPAPRRPSRHEIALRYASAGLRVVPLHGTKDGTCTCGKEACAWPGDHPPIEHGIDDATTNPEKIEEFWYASRNANIAIPTGAPDIAVPVRGEAETACPSEGTARQVPTLKNSDEGGQS